MIRTPLRPLARILRARERGENPDDIEAENRRRRHEQIQDRARRRAEGRLIVMAGCFMLAFMAIVWTVLMGIPIGVISAVKQDTWTDYAVRSWAIGGLSMPNFWIATMLLVFGSIWFR